jgi:hypothetical protein
MSLSCVGAYFEGWVKLLGLPLVIPKKLKKILSSKIGFVHGLCHPKSQIGLCKASLAHLS